MGTTFDEGAFEATASADKRKRIGKYALAQTPPPPHGDRLQADATLVSPLLQALKRQGDAAVPLEVEVASFHTVERD